MSSSLSGPRRPTVDQCERVNRTGVSICMVPRSPDLFNGIFEGKLRDVLQNDLRVFVVLIAM